MVGEKEIKSSSPQKKFANTLSIVNEKTFSARCIKKDKLAGISTGFAQAQGGRPDSGHSGSGPHFDGHTHNSGVGLSNSENKFATNKEVWSWLNDPDKMLENRAKKNENLLERYIFNTLANISVEALIKKAKEHGLNLDPVNIIAEIKKYLIKNPSMSLDDFFERRGK
ncbi:MAG: hypothetical protein ACD_12C00613G0001 [uncultured bacterium]|nr:MAG: hypothetical protein ACD_12C00613G0001 [uncultured bacterium]